MLILKWPPGKMGGLGKSANGNSKTDNDVDMGTIVTIVIFET